MKCINCGLINPNESQRCDCGFDFHTGNLEEPYCKDVNKHGKIIKKNYIIVAYILGVFSLLPNVISGRLALDALGKSADYRDGFGFFLVFLSLFYILSLPLAIASIILSTKSNINRKSILYISCICIDIIGLVPPFIFGLSMEFLLEFSL